MAYTKKGKIALMAGLILIPVIFVILMVVNWFIYPFSSAAPNFADVEAVYSRMKVPDTWEKLGEGSNSGIAGRQCPIESDGCFSKVGSFNVPIGTTEDEIKAVYISTGCMSVISKRTEQIGGGTTYTDFECSSGGLKVSGSLKEKDKWGLTINVSSR